MAIVSKCHYDLGVDGFISDYDLLTIVAYFDAHTVRLWPVGAPSVWPLDLCMCPSRSWSISCFLAPHIVQAPLVLSLPGSGISRLSGSPASRVDRC